MAIVAGIAAGNMRWVFADGSNSVVAGTASTNDLGVVDCQHRRKNIGAVAVLTDVRCLNVGWIFANCLGAIMAADAVAGDIHVIEIGR